MDEMTARRDLVDLLQAYIMGEVDLERLLAWEASLSLDPEAVGAVRNSLDELALVGEEVADGIRSEREFRGLALAVLVRETLRLSFTTASTASRSESIRPDIDMRAPVTLEPEITFAGT